MDVKKTWLTITEFSKAGKKISAKLFPLENILICELKTT